MENHKGDMLKHNYVGYAMENENGNAHKNHRESLLHQENIPFLSVIFTAYASCVCVCVCVKVIENKMEIVSQVI